MSTDADILTKKYIPQKELSKTIQKIAQQQNWNYSEEYDKKFDVFTVALNNDKEGEELEGMYINIYSEEDYIYYEKEHDFDFVSVGYNRLMSLEYSFGNKEDHILVPLVKSLQKVYPDLILYTEDTHIDNPLNYIALSKHHLENYNGITADGLIVRVDLKELENPPEKE